MILLTERLHIRRGGAATGADDRQRMLGGGDDGAVVDLDDTVGDRKLFDVAAAIDCARRNLVCVIRKNNDLIICAVILRYSL